MNDMFNKGFLSLALLALIGIGSPAKALDNLVLDGNLAEWSNAESLGVDGDDIVADGTKADILEAWASHDGSSLQLAYSNDGPIDDVWWPWHIFIDTDQKESTGYSAGNGVGAEYILQGNQLLKYTGSGSDWSWENIRFNVGARASQYAEFSLKLSDLGGSEGVNLLFKAKNSSFVDGLGSAGVDTFPNSGAGYFTVNLESDTEARSNALSPQIDGDLSDWSETTSFGRDGDDISEAGAEADILEAWMANDDEYLYLAYTNDGPINFSQWWPWQTYFDTDNNPETGYKTNGLGADYILQGAGLSRYVGSGSDWSLSFIGRAEFASGITQTELRIKRSDLDNPDNLKLVLQARNSSQAKDTLPNSGVYNYQMASGSIGVVSNLLSPTIDGELDDWSEAISFGTDGDDITVVDAQADWLEAWMAHDKDNLYLAYRNDGPINFGTWWPWQVYLDTDNNPETGFKSSGIGADFILQGRSLSRYTGTGSNWSWESEALAVYASGDSDQQVEMKLPLSILGDANKIKISLVARNSSFTNNSEPSGVDLYQAPGGSSELSYQLGSTVILRDAHRLLLQTTFGPVSADLDKVQQIGVEKWVDRQLNMPAAHDDPGDDHQTHLQRLIEIAKLAKPSQGWDASGDDGVSVFNRMTQDIDTESYRIAVWWENALGLHPDNIKHGSDQLRQRVAFALSQLLVVSGKQDPLGYRAEGLANYYDMLVRYSFGNYRALLGEMARSPIMGIYLSHQGNQKANFATGTIPDENFARELMQLFTLGLYELNMDGTPDKDGDRFSYPDSSGEIKPSYTEKDVQELAKVMTGWDLVRNNQYGSTALFVGDYTQPMEFTATEHEDEVAEGGDGLVTVLGKSFALNSGEDGSGLDEALDVLFNHPNIAPHVSKHLIMRLVTSNPSSDYVARVAEVFVDNGEGVRGDLKAVVRAILLDDEMRNEANIGNNDGKIKEPLIAYTQLLRTLGTVPLDGWLSNNDAKTPVNGVYWFKSPESSFGQGPLRSVSVFNFYTPDYVPSSNYFSDRGLVSPEMKILTDQNVLGYSNKVYSAVWSFAKNKIEYKDKKTIAEYAATRNFDKNDQFLTNFDEPMALIKAAAGGAFWNLEKSSVSERPNMIAAVNALINYYDRLLLGGEMPEKFKQALSYYLMNSSNMNIRDRKEAAIVMVKDTVRMIATSGLYMVQK